GRRTPRPREERRDADHLPQRGEGARLGGCPRNLEAFVARLAHGGVETMAAARRVLEHDGPRGVVGPAARALADEGDALGRLAPAPRRGAADALEQEDALVREPEVLRVRRSLVAGLAEQAGHDPAQLAPRLPVERDPRARPEPVQALAHAPRAQVRGRQDL